MPQSENRTKRTNKLNLGYIPNYIKTGINAIDENIDDRYISSNFDGKGDQRMSDKSSNLFKYGLENTEYFKYYNLDDPIFLSFRITINHTQDSPLFNNVGIIDSEDNNLYGGVKDVSNKYGLSNFIKDYGNNISEIAERQKLHQEFIKTLSKYFYIGGFSDLYGDNKIELKQHYINKIDGIDKFMKKMVKYDDDLLTIDLNEDVKMESFYLSELYNNLLYSYKNQRYIAPENLYRFNMRIDFSEWRNFVIPIKDYEKYFSNSSLNKYMKERNIRDIDTAKEMLEEERKNEYPFIRSPKSQFSVELYDCNFDFFSSKSTSDHINQAGFDSTRPTNQSFYHFNIKYKSVRRILDPKLLDSYYLLDNKKSYFEGSASEIEELPNKDNTLFNFSSDDNNDSDRKSLFSSLMANDLISSTNPIRLGNSLIDSAIGENNRRLLLDGINGLTGDGDFSLIKSSVRNYISTKVDEIRRSALLGLNDELSGNNEARSLTKLSEQNTDTWEEDIINGEGQYDRKPVSGELYDEPGYVYEKPEGVAYIEHGHINEKPEGVVYEEPEENHDFNPLNPNIYEENGSVYKTPEGSVYDENGPVYKPADGSVYEEDGPVYKPADGEVYEENGPVYKPADGEVYEEKGHIQEPLSGEVYEEVGRVFKLLNGEVYEEIDDNIVKIPDGEIYGEKSIVYKELSGKIYEEDNILDKVLSGKVYEKMLSTYKPADGRVYFEFDIDKKIPEGEVYKERGYVYKPVDGKSYEESGPVYKPVDDSKFFKLKKTEKREIILDSSEKRNVRDKVISGGHNPGGDYSENSYIDDYIDNYFF